MSIQSIKHICILGAGTMGAGIAQWFAQNNVFVELADANQDTSKKALSAIENSWNKLLSKGKFSKEDVLTFKDNIKIVSPIEFSKEADLFLEVIIENLDIKKSVFKTMDHHFDQDTIFASNTSSIPLDQIKSDLTIGRKNKFVGIHFFNPAPIMKLVEIISPTEVDQSLIVFLKSWFEQKQKKVALCQDGPGFIVNRIARNFYGESLAIVNNYNLEVIKELDDVMKEVGGFNMGPFELMDLIGIDVNYSVTESVWKSFYYHPRFSPHKLQKLMVDSRRLGKKTSKGFYEY